MTRGFVSLENGELSLQMKQKQEAEELEEQLLQMKRDREEASETESRRPDKILLNTDQSEIGSRGEVDKEGNWEDDVLVTEIESGIESGTSNKSAEGYGREPIIQLHQPSIRGPVDTAAIVNAFLTLTAQNLSDVHWYVILGDDTILDVENLAGVLNR